MRPSNWCWRKYHREVVIMVGDIMSSSSSRADMALYGWFVASCMTGERRKRMSFISSLAHALGRWANWRERLKEAIGLLHW